MAKSIEEAERLAREYRDLWNEKDYATIPDVVSEAYKGNFPEAEEVIRGPDALEEFMREFTSAFPDFHVEILDLLASEDTVMVEGKYTMTHEGEFNGIPPTEREVELSSMVKFLIEDGKIAEHREYHDRQEFLEQL